MFRTVVLVCSIATSHTACNEKTARAVVRGPVVHSEQRCGFLGQALIAPTAIVPDPASEYPKIRCERLRETASAIGG